MTLKPKKGLYCECGQSICAWRGAEEPGHETHGTYFPSQLGAKKGLGAQKVSNQSFSEIERQAQVAEKLREQQAADAKKQAEESLCVLATGVAGQCGCQAVTLPVLQGRLHAPGLPGAPD